MIMDLDEETPLFDMMEINGCLTLDETKDHTLNIKKILVRGENADFSIGTKKKPYTKNVIINLMGKADEPGIAIEERGTEAGNKIIANIGKINFYGKQRSFKMVRLAEEVIAGKSSIKVDVSSADGDIDLVVGDMIALAATGFEYDTGETFTVKKWEASTGTITLDAPTKWYHFGRSESTGDLYNGVDMRGEVLSLSRNIKIIGEDLDKHGCQILTSDIMELVNDPDTGDEMAVFYNGKMNLDSVEIINGG